MKFYFFEEPATRLGPANALPVRVILDFDGRLKELSIQRMKNKHSSDDINLKKLILQISQIFYIFAAVPEGRI